MRIGIYNRTWMTGGRAECCAVVIAGILSRDHRVEILGPEAVALPELSLRLGVDLSRAGFRLVPPLRECELAPLTRDYDLFFNCALESRLPSKARKSVYLVQLPRRPWPAGIVRAGQWLASSLAPGRINPVAALEGFYERDPSGARWSRNTALLRVQPWAFLHATARVRLCPPVSWSLREAVLGVEAEGVRWRIELDELVLDRLDPSDDEPIDVRIECRTFVPEALGVSPDRRRLGVRLPEQDPPCSWRRVRRLAQRVGHPIGDHDRRLSESYDLLVTVSEETRRRIAALWNRPSEVLVPPVDTEKFCAPQPAGKRRVILSVGHFRRDGRPGNFREMVRIFRKLVDHGAVPGGWRYHVAGDLCRERLDDIEYFAELEHLAEGYPVTLLVDPDPDRLVQECRYASIFWHTPDRARREPGRPSEYGPPVPTLGEAMSAGCIPMAVADDDARRLVRHGETGLLFRSTAELASITETLTGSDGETLRQTLMKQASVAAQRVALPRFEERLREVLLTHGVLT